MWTEEGKLYMLVAIDRTSKFAFAELHERATRRVAADFLRRPIAAVPYRIHTVLTPFRGLQANRCRAADNGTHFTDPKRDGWAAAEVKQMFADKTLFRCHSFALACARNDIDHRLTKPYHSWTNGQVERMLLGVCGRTPASQRNRTIKEATVRRHHYETHDRLREHLRTFIDADNFAKRLKTLKGLTPYEFVSAKWPSEPDRFGKHPDHLISGLNN